MLGLRQGGKEAVIVGGIVAGEIDDARQDYLYGVDLLMYFRGMLIILLVRNYYLERDTGKLDT